MKLCVDRELKFHYLMKYRINVFLSGYPSLEFWSLDFLPVKYFKKALVYLLLQVHEMIMDEKYCFVFASVYKLSSRYFSLHGKVQIKVIFNHIIVLPFASLYLYNDCIIIHVMVLGSEGIK